MLLLRHENVGTLIDDVVGGPQGCKAPVGEVSQTFDLLSVG